MRLIDADELIEHVWRDRLDSRELIANLVESMPTIEPQPQDIARYIATIIENEKDMRVILKNAQPERTETHACVYQRTETHGVCLDAWKADFKGFVDSLDMPRDDYKGIMEYIDEVPSAQPECKRACMPMYANVSDCISRQAAIDEAYEIIIDGQKFEVVQVETLMGLPPAQPQDIARDIATIIENEKDMRVVLQQQWIPTSKTETIPDHEVLACDKYGEEILGYLGFADDQWICESDSEVMYDPIAWMEKPEPYKGVTE